MEKRLLTNTSFCQVAQSVKKRAITKVCCRQSACLGRRQYFKYMSAVAGPERVTGALGHLSRASVNGFVIVEVTLLRAEMEEVEVKVVGRVDVHTL